MGWTMGAIMQEFSSKLLKSAATNAVIKEGQKRYGNKPDYPKEPEKVTELYAGLDNLVPKAAQDQGIGKQMYLYLLKQLFGVTPPGFILGEDDYRVRPLMQNYFEACSKGRLEGEAKNLDRYRSMEDLEEAVTPQKEKNDEEVLTYNESEQGVISKGAKVIYNQGGWVVYKIAKSREDSAYDAAKLLCDNSRNDGKWCVGRGMASTYIPQGDFFIIEKNGRSLYAISSQEGSDLTIWNPADTPIFTTGSRNRYGYGGGDGGVSLPSIKEAEKKAGVTFDFGQLSAIPKDIIPVLAAIRPSENTIQMIPESQLQDNVDQTSLYRILHFTDPTALARDLNNLYQSTANYITAHAIMSAALSPKVNMEFNRDSFEAMSMYTLTGYLEAAAGTGNLKLNPALDEILQPLCSEWLNS
jgi:hypothetical protein